MAACANGYARLERLLRLLEPGGGGGERRRGVAPVAAGRWQTPVNLPSGEPFEDAR
eukprot:SAG31_NODE_10652_length_1113_cov_2.232742_1_plen_55_part_10